MDVNAINAWTGIGTMIGLVVVGIMNKLDARRAVKAVESAARVAKDTHTLVNSNMGIQLRINALQARQIAVLTRNPDDLKLAETSESMYSDHMAKQAIVDRQHTETKP